MGTGISPLGFSSSTTAETPIKDKQTAIQQFEALFVQQLLKGFRESPVAAEAPSSDQNFGWEMIEGLLAQNIAQKGIFGLAQQWESKK